MKTKILIIILVSMAMTIIGLSKALQVQINEKDRYKSNQTALLDSVRHYKTKSGLNASEVQKLTLTKKEMKDHEAELIQTIDDLNLKLKRVKSASKTVTKTEYKIKPVFKDSLVYVEGIPDTLKCIDYKDQWLTVSGCIGDSLMIKDIVPILQFIDRVPRKFLFFRWGTKAIKQHVVSTNPHTKIVYSKYIELKK